MTKVLYHVILLIKEQTTQGTDLTTFCTAGKKECAAGNTQRKYIYEVLREKPLLLSLSLTVFQFSNLVV